VLFAFLDGKPRKSQIQEGSEESFIVRSHLFALDLLSIDATMKDLTPFCDPILGVFDPLKWHPTEQVATMPAAA
jgi:hypothetical protein